MSDQELYSIKDASYYACDRAEMLDFVPIQAKTILDIGCSEGASGAALKNRNHAEVWGIELMPDFGEKAKAKLDRVLVGDIQELLAQIPDNYFDAIVCNDVLEHIFLVEDLLVKLKSKLKVNGVFVSSIPNMRYVNNLTHILFKKDFRYEAEGIRDQTHMRFYTQKSIHDLFERCGFMVTQSQGINPSKSIRFYILRLLMPLVFRHDTKFVQIATIAVKK